MPDAALAVDIGGTVTRVAVVRGDMVVERREMPTLATSGPDDLLARLTSLMLEVQPDGACPVGVACTGRVHGGRVSAVNLGTMPGWVNVPVQDRLAGVLGRAVHVLNDAKAATLAEWDAGHDGLNFMFVTVSTGIGSGLVLGGRLHEVPDGRDVGLGFTEGLNGEGLEYGSSGRGLERVAVAAGFTGVLALFDAAEAAEARAREALRAPLHALTRRVADAHCLLGLDALCVGGSVGLRAYTQSFLQAELPFLRVRAARHGADAGVIGAARYAGRHA